MIFIAKNKITWLEFENLRSQQGISHFSTTRSGGVSKNQYESLNLGFNSGDDLRTVRMNRQLLCQALEIHEKELIFPHQTHTKNVKVIDQTLFSLTDTQKNHFLDQADALTTNLPGITIAIKTADCVPILLFDPITRSAAAIHAGWKSAAQKIVTETIRKMIRHYKTSPSDLIAAIGPSISQPHYEVGEEVWSRFPDHCSQNGVNGNPAKRHLNLWEANRYELIENGVKPENIEVAGICTYTNSGHFFSARRDGPQSGRMATGIRLL